MGTVVNILQREHETAWAEMLARKQDWEAAFAGGNPAEIVQAEDLYRAAQAREAALSGRIASGKINHDGA